MSNHTMGLDELVGEFCLVVTYIKYNIERFFHQRII